MKSAPGGLEGVHQLLHLLVSGLRGQIGNHFHGHAGLFQPGQGMLHQAGGQNALIGEHRHLFHTGHQGLQVIQCVFTAVYRPRHRHAVCFQCHNISFLSCYAFSYCGAGKAADGIPRLSQKGQNQILLSESAGFGENLILLSAVVD